MTQPDKWDEIATAMTRCWYRDAAQEYAIDTNQIAANLRSAYQEGERAERGRIEEMRDDYCSCYDEDEINHHYCEVCRFLDDLSAAKETKE